MLSDYSYRSVPRSLGECYRQDGISQKLWQWSKVIQILGIVLACILVVTGFILGISAASEVYRGGFGVFLVTFLTFALYAGLVLLSTYASALVFAGFATIAQNTRITADVALYSEFKSESGSEAPVTRIASSSTPIHSANTKISSDWICECGTKNHAGAMYCKDCGKYKK